MPTTPLPILSSRGVWEFDADILDEAGAGVPTSTYEAYLLEWRTGPNGALIDSCATGNGKIVAATSPTNRLTIVSHTAGRTFAPAAKTPVYGDLFGFIGSDDYPLGRIEFIADPTVTKGPRNG